MKALFSRIEASGNEYTRKVRRHGMWLAPGLFFFLIGAVTLIAPQLVITVIATIFFFLGAVVCAIGWKLMQLKGRVEKMARQFEGRVIVQGVNINPDVTSESESEQKKIIFH